MLSIRLSLISTVFLALAAVAAAQTPDDIPRLHQYTQGTPPILRFAIVDGRMIVRCRSASNFQIQSDYGSGKRETMGMRSDQGQTTLTYERTTAREQIKINVAGLSGKSTISRAPRGASAFVPMEFQQTPGQQTTLTLGNGDHRQVFQAGDFWRLAIVQQEECKEHLFPLLDMLRPDWKLATMAARVETSLLSHANQDTTANDARWAALVKQLGDDQFAKREAADRALRAGGASSLGYLRQVNFEHLDAEQQFRVGRILRAMSGRSDDDAADEVAVPLAREPAIWLALLGRPEVATRQTAARQLVKLVGKPIDIDPDAEPATQKGKREKLRAQIEKK